MLFFPMINGGTKRAKGRLLCLCMHLEHDVSITMRTLWTKAAMWLLDGECCLAPGEESGVRVRERDGDG